MNPLSINPIPLLGAGAAALLIGFGGGWMVNGWRLNTEIAQIKSAHADEKAKHAIVALSTMKADAEAIHKAATEYAAIETTLAPKIAALTKELKNAKPLPAGCLPDPVRVRNLESAIEAANAAIAR